MNRYNVEENCKRSMYYFGVVIAIVIAMGTGIGSFASAKTVELGRASTSWSGNGEIHELADGSQVLHGIGKGLMIIRPANGDSGIAAHTAPIVCSVLATVDTKKNHRTQRAICSVIKHESKDVAFAQFKCEGSVKECEGTFTFTDGVGEFSGISETTPFSNMFIFQKLESGNALVIGQASWPNLTYTLP